ncbi:MAG TPA: hypothetical protein VFQ36_23560 [Ktedonobacteraceae bacterium]|nr:hypothetical protein [Ktedonobacteraceae bacterium]
MPVDKYFLTTVRIGDIVVYKMLPKNLPVNPDKEWHGKILRIHLDEPRIMDCLFVESLEEGESGMTEIVYLSQIVKKENC